MSIFFSANLSVCKPQCFRSAALVGGRSNSTLPILGQVKHTFIIRAFTSLFWALREQQKLLYPKGDGRIMRFWNSLLSTDKALLSRVVQADLRLADKKGCGTNQVLMALHDIPQASAQQFATAIRARARIDMNDLESVLHEQSSMLGEVWTI
eukprot:209221-Pelagomonas_calceolata.AAC.1